ncbi:MAG: D-alanyl-D-alanine carboxypeptidase [Oscillospiraceae bacterium]|nr:D-alanyl-D-alanine carboxypeptidase [Oscillospiraceae bacterium]
MRNILCMFLAVCLLLGLAPAVRATDPAPAEVEISAPSAILIDAATGTVLFAQNADERREPASVTKVMTLLLVMEALDNGSISWDDQVVASAAAAGKGGSQIYLEEGERLTMDEALKSVVVASANDCATALAEHVAGSETAFVAQMNRRAQELGMTGTHFVNCTGLDDDPAAKEHLTTARDVAIMSRELLKHQDIRKYTTIWMDTVRNGAFGLANTNKLVRFYQGTTGLKTGYTSAAGHCLSASAQRDGIELIAVVLGCASSTARFEDAKALLNWGFANYALATPDLDLDLSPIPVTLGKADSVSPLLPDSSPILIRKSQQASITRQVELEEELEAPVLRGQVIGTLRVMAGDTLLKELPLTAEADVPRLSYWEIWLRVFRSAFGKE